MINKKGVWFLTLFSLILVLSVYYITMPPELLMSNSNLSSNVDESTPVVNMEESSILVALRVESDEEMDNEITALKKIVSDSKSSIEDKNKAFEKIKELNSNRSTEETIENKIENEYKIKSFVKIKENNIEVIATSTEHNVELANKIMRLIQSNFNTAKNITVKFQK